MISKNVSVVETQMKEALSLSPYHQNPELIVVTKRQSVQDISKLYEMGYRHFAENRVESLLERREQFPQRDIVWHLIGSLQSRKVKDMIGKVDYFHALDRMKLIQVFDKHLKTPLNCFLQVNVFNESSKHGFFRDEINEAVEAIRKTKNIRLVGLMAMAPIEASDAHIALGFKTIKKIQQSIENQHISNCPCHFTSMGMSGDFQLALQEGATHIRVGSALFKRDGEGHGI